MKEITEEAVAEIVEDVLAEMGLPWKRREGGWVVPASAHRPREVMLSTSPEGLRVEAELCSWDTLGESEHRALSIVLEKASACQRFARCAVGAARATVAATLPAQAVEAGLRTAIGGVLVGSRALAREASALLTPNIAGEVLRFFGADAERKMAPERI